MNDEAYIAVLKDKLAAVERKLERKYISKGPQSDQLTPGQVVAQRFHLEDKLLADPRVAKLLDYKARLDEAASKLGTPEERKSIGRVRPSPEHKAKLIGKIRAMYKFGDHDKRPDLLISSIAETLLFTARLRKSAAANNQGESPNEKNVNQ